MIEEVVNLSKNDFPKCMNRMRDVSTTFNYKKLIDVFVTNHRRKPVQDGKDNEDNDYKHPHAFLLCKLIKCFHIGILFIKMWFAYHIIYILMKTFCL